MAKYIALSSTLYCPNVHMVIYLYGVFIEALDLVHALSQFKVDKINHSPLHPQV